MTDELKTIFTRIRKIKNLGYSHLHLLIDALLKSIRLPYLQKIPNILTSKLPFISFSIKQIPFFFFILPLFQAEAVPLPGYPTLPFSSFLSFFFFPGIMCSCSMWKCWNHGWPLLLVMWCDSVEGDCICTKNRRRLLLCGGKGKIKIR